MLLKKKKNSQIFEGIVPYSTSQVILIPGPGLLTCGRYWRDPDCTETCYKLCSFGVFSSYLRNQTSVFRVEREVPAARHHVIWVSSLSDFKKKKKKKTASLLRGHQHFLQGNLDLLDCPKAAPSSVVAITPCSVRGDPYTKPRVQFPCPTVPQSPCPCLQIVSWQIHPTE